MSGKLIIISAPSGAGKTTIVKELISEKEFKLQFSVSACSRPKREHETDGKDYYFLGISEFKMLIEKNEFAEWEEVYDGMFYGTLKSEIERITSNGFNAVFDIDVAGALSLKEIYGQNALTVFIKVPSIKELENRLRNRETETEESIKKRISKAEYEITFAEKFDKIVVNDKLETAVAECKNIVNNFLA